MLVRTSPVVAEAKTWHPDLDSRSDAGIYRFAPATIPWDQPIRSAADIPRLPDLSGLVRRAETAWAEEVGRAPQAAADAYLKLARGQSQRFGGPLVIEVDEIKMLCPYYREPFNMKGREDPYSRTDREKISAAIYNKALHATATGVARIAFETALDQLPPESVVMVMAGGVAAGKGYAVANMKDIQKGVGLVLDPDGESSQTFLPTVHGMVAERGHQLRFVGVRTEPELAWTRCLDRASKKGRLPDEALFAHSHSRGVENMVKGLAWLDQQDSPGILIDNGGDTPRRVEPDTVPIPGFHELYDRIQKQTDQRLDSLTPWHVFSLMQGRKVFSYV